MMRLLGPVLVVLAVLLWRPARADTPASKPPPKPACPDGMVHISAGSFAMGSPDSSNNGNEKPQHQVTLSGYCIDKTEVTVAAYAKCVSSGRCDAASTDYGGCNGNRKDRQKHPVNCVDWNDAKTYCGWSKKRLPTEAEWEYAARGSDGRTYAWGNQDPDSSRLVWKTDGTAPVGSVPAGASAFGVLDMAGNVMEWTADGSGPYADNAQTNPKGAADDSHRVVRGGSWRAGDSDGVRAAFRGFGDVPTIRSDDLGFRCVRAD